MKLAFGIAISCLAWTIVVAGEVRFQTRGHTGSTSCLFIGRSSGSTRTASRRCSVEWGQLIIIFQRLFPIPQLLPRSPGSHSRRTSRTSVARSGCAKTKTILGHETMRHGWKKAPTSSFIRPRPTRTVEKLHGSEGIESETVRMLWMRRLRVWVR